MATIALSFAHRDHFIAMNGHEWQFGLFSLRCPPLGRAAQGPPPTNVMRSPTMQGPQLARKVALGKIGAVNLMLMQSQSQFRPQNRWLCGGSQERVSGNDCEPHSWVCETCLMAKPISQPITAHGCRPGWPKILIPLTLFSQPPPIARFAFSGQWFFSSRTHSI